MGSQKEHYKIEANPELIEKIKKSMWAVWKNGGIVELINTYAETIAYQHALNEMNFELYKDIAKEIKKANARKD